MIRAVLRLSVGMLTVTLTSACSSSLPRTVPTQATAVGGSSGQPSGGAAVSAAVAQPDLKGGNAPPPNRQSEADASQADVDNALRQRGYKPALYRGKRIYCRNEVLTGSNLASKVCLTAQQIVDQERAAKDILDRTRPAGCLTAHNGCD
jgi:hypothetical protein